MLERGRKRTVMTMALVKHDRSKHELAPRRLEFFDRFFDDWPEMLRRPVLFWPDRGLDSIGVEEFTEDGTLVVRVELAGIDPDKDVEVSIEDDVLHIGAERRQEERTEERNYVRRELRYGSFHRDLPLPKGTSETDVKASYKDGILEVRVPAPTEAPAPSSVKVPISKD
jgi:HSP20 family protein